MYSQPPNPHKVALRRTLRGIRRDIPDAVRRSAGRAVERLALRHRLLSKGRRIGFYVPSKGELDCLPLLDRALRMGVKCLLPVVPHHRQKKLWFSQLGEGPHWVLNRYGIPEYGLPRGRLRVSALAVLFIPLLGFDARGYRMGMGGGYYDASLAFLDRRRSWRKPRIIGLAFEAQKMHRLPEDPWDIPLDAVITERRYYRFQ